MKDLNWDSATEQERIALLEGADLPPSEVQRWKNKAWSAIPQGIKDTLLGDMPKDINAEYTALTTSQKFNAQSWWDSLTPDEREEWVENLGLYKGSDLAQAKHWKYRQMSTSDQRRIEQSYNDVHSEEYAALTTSQRTAKFRAAGFDKGFAGAWAKREWDALPEEARRVFVSSEDTDPNIPNTAWLEDVNDPEILEFRKEACRAARQDEKWAKVEWHDIPAPVRRAITSLGPEDFSAKQSFAGGKDSAQDIWHRMSEKARTDLLVRVGLLPKSKAEQLAVYDITDLEGDWVVNVVRYLDGQTYAAESYQVTLPTEDPNKPDVKSFSSLQEAAVHVQACGFHGSAANLMHRVRQTGKWSSVNGARVEKFASEMVPQSKSKRT